MALSDIDNPTKYAERIQFQNVGPDDASIHYELNKQKLTTSIRRGEIIVIFADPKCSINTHSKGKSHIKMTRFR